MAHIANDTSSGDAPHETRWLILQAAQRLFMEQGYRAVSTRQIAAACGITQPALYRHFATKQELYIAVLLELLGQTQAHLTRLVTRQEDVLQRIRLVARYLPTTWEDTQQMFHDIEHELDEQGRKVVSEAFMSHVVAPIMSLFNEGVAQGLLRDAEHGGLDALAATFLLFRLLNDNNMPAPHAHGQHTDRMVNVLLHGLLHHPETEA